MPSTLVKVGFITGIIEMCRQINSMNTIDISLNTELKESSVDKKTELHLYRLIKEIINNIIKHTEASTICIHIDKIKSYLVVRIFHNGKGINTEEARRLAESSQGIGLKSIFGRVNLTNSIIEYIGGNEPTITIKTPIS